MQFLVPCDHLIISGGLLRFDRLGRQLKELGHELAFLVMSETATPQRGTTFPVLSLAEAKKETWDATMIPGAGFPISTIEKFAWLREQRFGVRIQHVLNDQTRREWFLRVNEFYLPNIVIFNNFAWPESSRSSFYADEFHTLVGGVNYDIQGNCQRKSRDIDMQWIIGGLVNKNPLPLLESLPLLPENVVIRLFGIDTNRVEERYSSLVKNGRIQLCGKLGEEELSEFYMGVDCVVMTEHFAGWSNLVAESMAAGVPVVCTKHGTQAIAFEEDSALIVNEPEPKALAAAILRLMESDLLCKSLSSRAREVVRKYSWAAYAQGFLEIINGYRSAPKFRA